MPSVPTQWDDPLGIRILLLANFLDPWTAVPNQEALKLGSRGLKVLSGVRIRGPGFLGCITCILHKRNGFLWETVVAFLGHKLQGVTAIYLRQDHVPEKRETAAKLASVAASIV